MVQLNDKLEKLTQLLQEMGTVVIGFSGGVDSSFLAAAAQRVLGDNAVAVTAYSETLPDSERQEAIDVAKQIGIRHVLLHSSELVSDDFVANTAERCYFCKKERFSDLKKWADEEQMAWVLEGSNADDKSDYRPGMRAINELTGVRSPLLEAGLTKAEIRKLSKEWGVPTWNKPSAACLSSRVAYGLPITAERLKQIELAEAVIKQFCAGQVRVRHHDQLARIEVSPEDIPVLAAPDKAALISGELRKLGFMYVTLDLSGYRTGSMNAVLDVT
ncbi:ATP-dependent sacrificial sulfur transferase LarE [Sporomusa ovata]|uniref:ATP-dependent sacrificial sulfur transferase LarE n=1 Tax=Sporomusa ovata TaxID=2378 RepID=UPI00048B9883|nr:ATP-dependent sacrificial sulfur transferase LarE [Sporomusa ovata]